MERGGGEERSLVRLCIAAATYNREAVELWRRQRRTIDLLPSPISAVLFHTLLRRRLLFPSLLQVFKHNIEEVDLSGESSVDAEWMAYIGAFQYLTSLKLADCHKINDHALWPIVGLTNLKEVDLSRCSKVTDAGIRHLLPATNLEKLHISETGVTAKGVSLLSLLTDLTVLDLGGLPVTDPSICSLLTLTKLEHLDLWGSDITNEGAHVLRLFLNLSFLNLAWTKVTDVPYMSSLTYLNMSNCTVGSIFQGFGDKANLSKLILSGTTYLHVSRAFLYLEASLLSYLDISNSSLEKFDFLSQMGALEHLDLSSLMITDVSVHLIALVGGNLRFLNLNKTRITSTGVSVLAGNVPKLEELLLSGTGVDDLAISYLSLMPSLKVINISKTNIKGFIHQMRYEPNIPSLAALQNLPNLEKLEMEDSQVTDAALESFSGLKQLKYLFFRNNFLTDASLNLLSSVPNLTSLSVRDAVLTNAGIEYLNPPETLKTLDLRGCWLLTEDVLSSFSKKYPQIEIKHELVIPNKEGKSNYSPPSQGKFKSSNSEPRHRTISPLISLEDVLSSFSKKYPQIEIKHELVIPNKEGKSNYSPPSQGKFKSSNSEPRHRTISPLISLDQRLKYSREELLALQLSSSSPFSGLERGNT